MTDPPSEASKHSLPKPATGLAACVEARTQPESLASGSGRQELRRRRWLGAGSIAFILLAGLIWLAPCRRMAPGGRSGDALRSALVLREGRLCLIGDTVPFSGIMIELRPDGSLRSRSEVVAGHLHGLSEGWHTNGQLQIQERFVRGVSHGLRTKWYASGATQSQANVVEGRLDGTFQQWHENGRLAEQILIQRDRPEGSSRAYYASGCLKAQALTRQGQVVERHFWKDGERPGDTATSAENH